MQESLLVHYIGIDRFWCTLQQQQGVEGVASVAGGPGTKSEGLGDTEEDYDEELGFDEEANEEEIDNEELEVAGGYPGSNYAEDDGGIAG